MVLAASSRAPAGRGSEEEQQQQGRDRGGARGPTARPAPQDRCLRTLPERRCRLRPCSRAASPSRMVSACLRPAISAERRATSSSYVGAVSSHWSWSFSRYFSTAASSVCTEERSDSASAVALSRSLDSLVLYCTSLVLDAVAISLSLVICSYSA